MLKKLARKILLTLCAAVLTVVSAAGVLLVSSVYKASAAESAWKTASFQMEDGVSLKLGAEKNGLRFIVSMDESIYTFLKENDTAKLGVVISTRGLMEAAGGDYINMAKKVGGELKKEKLYKNGDVYCANACLTNIKLQNFELDFTAVAYLQYGEEIRYTEYNTLARNNLYDTVNMAVLNGYTDEILSDDLYTKNVETGEGWYGSDQFPIVVENTEEYDTIVEATKTHNLSALYLAVESGVESSTDFEKAENKPNILFAAADRVVKMITPLPDSVTMPDHLVFVSRIEEARDAYNALTDEEKSHVTNYAKLNALTGMISGYETVFRQSVEGVDVIPSHVPNYSSDIGGSSVMGYDGYYGDFLRVTPDAGGKVAIQVKNFPDVSKYSKLYFSIRLVGASCDIYLSDDTANGGYGTNWKNTWNPLTGYSFWANNGNWIQKEVYTTTEIFSDDWALGLRTANTDVSFEITDIVGVVSEDGYKTSLSFGTRENSYSFNEHGIIYNLTPAGGTTANTGMGVYTANTMKNALVEGHNALHYWIYNPNETEEYIELSGDMNSWNSVNDRTYLAPKAWTEVVYTLDQIEANTQGAWYVNVSNGSNTKGWQTSMIFSCFKEELVDKAQAVIDLIETLDVNNIDEGLVTEARTAYNALTDEEKVSVTNYAKLEECELLLTWSDRISQVETQIANLPDSVTMPDHLVFVSRIEDAKAAYNELPSAMQTRVSNRAKLTTLVNAIEGYETVFRQSVEGVDVIPSHVPNYSSNIGGSAVMGYDGYYGNYLRATPDAGGRVAIQFKNFPDVSKYSTIYFNIRVVGASCDIYLSDGITHDGWGDNYKNTWSMSGFWTNNSNWIQKEVNTATGIFSSNWALGLRTGATDVYFEITDIVGVISNAGAVIDLINEIDIDNIDAGLVTEARAAYNALTDEEKASVTNYAKLEECELLLTWSDRISQVETQIANLPDSVTMPDHLVFVSRIEDAKAAYNELPSAMQTRVSNHAKLTTLVNAIEGYETVFRQSVEGVDVIPSHVPNYSSNIGGSAVMGYDGYYGNYLRATPDAGGKVAIQFKNFPNVSKYSKLYFNIRVVGASCDIYLSDGITHDGWGDDYKNTWSMSGFWTNNSNWIQKEVNTATGIFSSNWALGLRTGTTDVYFEITDIVGVICPDGNVTSLSFGNRTETTTINEHGTVYDLKPADGSTANTGMGAFNQNAMANALASGDNALHYWIYNPNETEVYIELSGDMNNWNSGYDRTTLAPKAWTEVIYTAEQIEKNKQGTWFVNVSSGSGAEGWQVSAIYSFVLPEGVDGVQLLIDELNEESTQEQVDKARREYEKLLEADKVEVKIDNLIACETRLYGDVENAPFVTNQLTTYKIYIQTTDASVSTAIATAANYAKTHVAEATGATLSIVSDRPVLTKYSYAIVFGYEDLYEALGVTIPTEGQIGASGYMIKRVGRVVFIFATTEDGYRMGMLTFLRETIGYDMVAEESFVYSMDGKTLPAFNEVEAPSFAYRQRQTYMTAEEIYGMGLHSHTDVWIDVEGWDMHNSILYLPYETYGETYSSWYYTGTVKQQICPTAGGNAAAYEAMLNTIVEVIKVRMDARPEIRNISFSMMDGTGDTADYCTCAQCSAYTTAYGSQTVGFSAAWIDLINNINARVQAYIEAERPGRELNIAFLAYRATEAAPVESNGNLMQRRVVNTDGSYALQTDASGNPVYLKCDEGVTVWLAPINGKFAENFNHTENAATLALIQNWCKLSDSVYLWMYGTNFKYYMYPYNSWQASAENYKIAYDLGVKAVWSQSNETRATAFTDLKSYIDSVYMRDVYADYNTVLETYFGAYFGPAAVPMRKMFNAIVTQCDEVEKKGVGRGIYDEIKNVKSTGLVSYWKTKYWAEDWLTTLLGYIDEANTAIDGSSLSDERKALLRERVLLESLFPRYVLYKDFQTAKENRTQFVTDCNTLGVTLFRESEGEIADGDLWS